MRREPCSDSTVLRPSCASEASPLVLAEAAIHHGQDDDLTVISILRTA